MITDPHNLPEMRTLENIFAGFNRVRGYQGHSLVLAEKSASGRGWSQGFNIVGSEQGKDPIRRISFNLQASPDGKKIVLRENPDLLTDPGVEVTPSEIFNRLEDHCMAMLTGFTKKQKDLSADLFALKASLKLEQP